MNKKEVRSYMKELKTQLNSAQIQTYSDNIKERLFNDPSFISCNQLYCYVSFNQEVLTKDIINTALLKNIKVAVPKIVGNEMRFYAIESLHELQPGTLGILEPVTGNEVIPDVNLKNLVIVPGMAFDRMKNRIGYGGGYYDSFFQKYSNVPMVKIALAYDFQVLEKLPTEEYDKKVDKIITNTEII